MPNGAGSGQYGKLLHGWNEVLVQVPGPCVRYGYRRLHILLRREGWSLGREQTYRLSCEVSLQWRSKRPRRREIAVGRREKYVARRPNQAWSMDFVADQLVNGTRFRALTIVDVYTREALAIAVGQRPKAEDVVAGLQQARRKARVTGSDLCR